MEEIGRVVYTNEEDDDAETGRCIKANPSRWAMSKPHTLKASKRNVVDPYITIRNDTNTLATLRFRVSEDSKDAFVSDSDIFVDLGKEYKLLLKQSFLEKVPGKEEWIPRTISWELIKASANVQMCDHPHVKRYHTDGDIEC